MDQKKYDDMTKEEQDAYDKQERVREEQEQAGLPYRWSQDLAVVSVVVDLPKGTRGKDLNVVIEKRKLKVCIEYATETVDIILIVAKVQVKGSEPILEGALFNDVSKDDSSWTIGR